jgi:hypothetical protein
LLHEIDTHRFAASFRESSAGAERRSESLTSDLHDTTDRWWHAVLTTNTSPA